MSDTRAPSWLTSLPGVGALVLVAVAILGLQPGGDRKPAAGAAPAPAGGADPRAESAPGLEEYLRAAGLWKPGTREPATGQLRYLVVTLPDPLLSQDGTRFDLQAEAVTHAMVAAGYLLDGHWFPWQPKAFDKDGRVASRAGRPDEEPGVLTYRSRVAPDDRFVVLVVGEDALTGLRVRPLRAALQLASGPRGEDVVGVIGPTFSGSQYSLARAVVGWDEEVRQLTRRAAQSAVSAAVERVAPGFGGVGAGPAAASATATARPRRVRVVSGSALGLKNWREVDERMVTLGGGEAEVRRTCVPLTSLRMAALHYLAAPGRAPADTEFRVPPRPVPYASLIELNSGYGAAAAGAAVVGTVPKPTRPAHPKDGPPPPEPDPAAAGPPKPSPGAPLPTYPEAAVVARFPMHVSRAAALLSKEQREREERLGLYAPGRVSLTALDAAATRSGDLLPAADEGRTAAVNLLRLDQYWDLIRTEKVRYVEVVATDPRDTLFLVRLLREKCPNVLPLTYGAAAQYGHPDYLPYTRGMVVVGTYPHRPAAQGRTFAVRDTRGRATFGSDSAQGTYNAVVAELQVEGMMFDYAPPGGGGNVPPVWVSAIGEDGGVVPLAYFTGYPERGVMLPGPRPGTDPGVAAGPVRPPHPAALRWLVLGVTLAAAGATAVGVRAYRRVIPDADLFALRNLYAALAAGGLLFAALPFAVYFWVVLRAVTAHPEGKVDWRDGCVVFLVGLVVFAAVGSTLRAFALWAAAVVKDVAVAAGANPARLPPRLRAVSDAIPAGAARTGASALTALAFAATALVLGWFAADGVRVDAARWWVFAERAAALDAGASPLIPSLVFAVGFGLYGVVGLWLVRDMADVRVNRPYPHPPPRPLAGAALAEIDRQGEDVWGLLTRPMQVFWRPDPGAVGPWWERLRAGRPRTGGLVVLGLVVTGGVMVLVRALPTWEARAWNCLFATGFVALAYLTVASGYRLYAVWKGVEQTARAVMALPMGRAFDRLPDKVSKVCGAYLLARRWRRLDLALFEHIRDRTLAAVEAAANQGWDDWARVARDRARGWAARFPGGWPPAAGSVTGDHAARLNLLAGLAVELADALGDRHWAAAPRPAGEAFGGVPVKTGEESPDPKTWTDWAEQFVAVMAVVYLAQYFVRMRHMALMAAAASGTLLVAATAYQFQPERLVLTAGLAMAGAVVGLILWVLYRVNRNELVSRVSRSTPNRFSLDSAFVSNVVTLVLPLALVITAQFAGRTRTIVEPILGWFH